MAVLRGRNGFRGAYDASALFACWFWEFVIVMLVEIDVWEAVQSWMKLMNCFTYYSLSGVQLPRVCVYVFTKPV